MICQLLTINIRMILAKPFQLENLKTIQEIILDFLSKKHIDYDRSDVYNGWVDELMSIKIISEEINKVLPTFEILGMGLIIMKPYGTMPIHSDTSDWVLDDRGDINLNGTYAFNIPILNYENTFTSFYESSKDPEFAMDTNLSDNDEPQAYFRYDEDCCREIHRIEMSQPHLINTKVPHCGHNPNPTPRILLNVRFNPNSETL